MSGHEPHRMRITFRKGDPVKYISHLDLLRAWERILRRARLPLAYSRGFHPHPKIVIAMPLPVGCTSDCEVLDITLDERLPADAVIASLEPVTPQGISVIAAEEVPLRGPAMTTLIRRTTYQVTLTGVPRVEVERRVSDLMHRDTLQVEFRRKTVDLVPLIASLVVKPISVVDREDALCGPDGVVLEATLVRDKKGRIGRPDVLLAALGLSDYARRIHRTEIIYSISTNS